MRIAILGWGSLIWCPGDLAIEGRWHKGPSLPVEFVRKSNDDRVTLVLFGTQESPTFWAHSSFTDIEEACDNLWKREGRPKRRSIHYTAGASFETWNGRNPEPDSLDVSGSVNAWLNSVPELDCAVWTGLPPKAFNVAAPDLDQQVVGHLGRLEGPALSRAKDYVELTPEAVQTPIRAAIEEAMGWMPRTLPASLFEDVPLPGGLAQLAAAEEE